MNGDELDVLGFQFAVVMLACTVFGIIGHAWWIDRKQRKNLERRRRSITLAARRRK
jgi:hypothetical protein